MSIHLNSTKFKKKTTNFVPIVHITIIGMKIKNENKENYT